MEQTQVNHWGIAFGESPVPNEWSQKNSEAKIKSDNDQYYEKYARISNSVKNKLIVDITAIINKGITESVDIYDELSKKGLIPVVGDKLASRNCIYRYAGIIKQDFDVKVKPPLHERIARLYRSGVTNRETIRKTFNCSKDAVYRSLINNGFIEKSRKIKKQED